ncbi:hypothetical protein RUND412_004124 [Rhizina undulata]
MASEFTPFLANIWEAPATAGSAGVPSLSPLGLGPVGGKVPSAEVIGGVGPVIGHGSGFAGLRPAVGTGVGDVPAPQVPLKVYVVPLARPYVLPFYKACTWTDFSRIVNQILSDIHVDPAFVNTDTPLPNAWMVVDRDGSIISSLFWEDLVVAGGEYCVLSHHPITTGTISTPGNSTVNGNGNGNGNVPVRAPVPTSTSRAPTRPSTSTSDKSASSVATGLTTATPRASISSGSGSINSGGWMPTAEEFKPANPLPTINNNTGGNVTKTDAVNSNGSANATTNPVAIDNSRKMKYSEVAASPSSPDHLQTLRQLLSNMSTVPPSASTTSYASSTVLPSSSISAAQKLKPPTAPLAKPFVTPQTGKRESMITMKVFERDTLPCKARSYKLSSGTSVGEFITHIGGSQGSRLQELRIVPKGKMEGGPDGKGDKGEKVVWKGQTFMSGTGKSLEDVGWGERGRKWGFVGVVLRK